MGVFIALVALYHCGVNWIASGNSKYFYQTLDCGIQCLNKMVVKLSYHHRQQRVGRHLQLLRFPPLDHTRNQRCYISVTIGSYYLRSLTHTFYRQHLYKKHSNSHQTED